MIRAYGSRGDSPAFAWGCARFPLLRRKQVPHTIEGLENRVLLAVTMVADLAPADASSDPHDLVEFQGMLYFSAYEATHGDELRKTDGTAAGTVLVKDINPGAGSSSISFPRQMTVKYGGSKVKSVLFFAADDGTSGAELWMTDGTPGGTVRVGDINPGAASSSPGSLTVVGDTLFFSADDGVHGRELWKATFGGDGSVSAAMVADIYPGTDPAGAPHSGGAGSMIDFNGKLLFTAADGDVGIEPRISDGTTVTLVKDINPGGLDGGGVFLPYNSFAGGYINYKGEAYFTASTNDLGSELWKTNGTAGGTTLVADIWPGKDDGGTPDSGGPRELTVVGDTLYFVAYTPLAGYELFQSTGTGFSLAADIFPGLDAGGFPNSSDAEHLVSLYDRLFFLAADPGHGPELWTGLHGAGGGLAVSRLETLPGPGGGFPMEILAGGGTVYFKSSDGVHGYELWRVDGLASAGPPTPALTADVDSGIGASAAQLTIAGGTLYFTADDGIYGSELWKLAPDQPAPGTSYPSMDITEGAPIAPPDPNGAAGPGSLVSVVNSRIEFRTKSGTRLYSDSLSNFFAPLAPIGSIFDPRVIYDPHSSNFFVVALVGKGAASHILVAQSDDSDPTDPNNATDPTKAWFYLSIASAIAFGGATYGADFPNPATDEHVLYITADLFTVAIPGTPSVFGGSRLWIIDKSQRVNTATVRRFDPSAAAGLPARAFVLQPARMFGQSPSDTGTFLVSTASGAGGWTDGADNDLLSLIRVDDPVSAAPTFTNQFISLGDIVSSTSVPTAPQSGSATNLDAGTYRAYSAVWRNNALWVATTIDPLSGPDAGQATVHWVKIDTSDLSTLKRADQGNIGGEDLGGRTATFDPFIAVDSAGNMAIEFAASNFEMYPGAYYTGRRFDDPAGTVRATQLLRAGEGPSVWLAGDVDNRWGDNTGLALDPAAQNTFWGFNEYSLLAGPGAGDTGLWSTRWKSLNYTDSSPLSRVIGGLKFHDLNMDGVQQAGEPPLAGWTIFIDANNNGILDAGEKSDVTNASGFYAFAALGPGTYRIREVPKDGWLPISPSDGVYTITLQADDQAVGRDFGNFEFGTISGIKFNDVNRNGTKDPGELPLAGWTIFLDQDYDDKLDPGERSTVTAADGSYSFANLTPGSYYVEEVLRDGWTRTLPAAVPYHAVFIAAGTHEVDQDFGNAPPPSLLGGSDDDVVYARLDPGGQLIQVYVNADPAGTPTYYYGLGSSFTFNGFGGDDTLILDFANGSPILSGGLTFNGGANSAAGDLVHVIGSPGNDEFVLSEDVGGGPPVLVFNEIEKFRVDGEGGNDTLTVDYSNGNPIPSGGLTFDGGAGADRLLVSGTDSATAMVVEPGQVSVGVAVITHSSVESIALDGPANGVIDVGSLSLSSALALVGGKNLTLRLSTLGISAAGALDVADNDLILKDAGAAPLADVRNWLHNGQIGLPQSILTSTPSPAAGYDTGLGLVDNALLHLTTWDGHLLSGFSQLIIKHTYSGDTNLDGQVTEADHLNVIANMGSTNAQWFMGDLNHDGVVTADDLAVVAANMGAGFSGPSGPPLAVAAMTSAAVAKPAHKAARAINTKLALLVRKLKHHVTSAKRRVS